MNHVSGVLGERMEFKSSQLEENDFENLTLKKKRKIKMHTLDISPFGKKKKNITKSLTLSARR